AALVGAAARVERPRTLILLLRPPGAGAFFTTDGRSLAAPELAAALERGQTSLRLGKAQAGARGAPARAAPGGVARAGGGAGVLGPWGVVAVATAETERDREQRARWRLVLTLALAGGLLVAFGSMMLRLQHKELGLERELALAEMARQRDEQLERASKVATM